MGRSVGDRAMNKPTLFLVLFIFSISIVSAINFVPGGNIEGYNVWGIQNMSNITSAEIYQNGNQVIDEGDVNTTTFNYSLYSNSTVYWDGETSQADLNVNHSSTSNSSSYWDNLNSPSDINAGDITDDGTYIASADEGTLNVNSSTYWALVSSWDSDWFINSASMLSVNTSTFNDTVNTLIALQNVVYNASVIFNETGIVDAGDIDSIKVCGDGDIYNVSEVSGVPGFDIRINFTSVSQFNKIYFNGYYDGVVGHEVLFQLYNHNTSTWDSFGEITDQAGFLYSTFDVGDDSPYIDSGIVQSRIYHETYGVVTHMYYLDCFFIEQLLGSSSISEHDALSGRDSISNHPWAMDTGATRSFSGDVNFGGNNILNISNISGSGYIDMSEMSSPATPSTDSLRLYVEDIKGFSFFKYLDDTGMKRQLLRDSMILVKNIRGTTIPANRVVYATGSSDNVPTVNLAKADDIATMPAIGVTVESIANGSYGRVMQVGLLENIDTTYDALVEGDILYVSDTSAGIVTRTAPLTPNLTQEIGTVLVVNDTEGAIQVIARGINGDDHGTIYNFTVQGDLTATNIIGNMDASNLSGLDALNDGITLQGENITGGTIAFARLPSLDDTHTHDYANITNPPTALSDFTDDIHDQSTNTTDDVQFNSVQIGGGVNHTITFNSTHLIIGGGSNQIILKVNP